ncbi:A24 family peptidase C-terminal domain-containing protein [Halostella litorea]|uniref:A24 family peptidase C-terminal domain-containing protein n=1 Tax=Halostella litorea TaxID=2528831 RepID=UPI0010930367|nr:A24 family peptidase C-terminal domain-containing protein [Halostella litorea]
MPGPLVDAAPTDLLRLLAVPVFAWAAYRDIATRRVSNAVWAPLAAFALALLSWDAWTAWTAGEFAWRGFLVPTAVSVGLVIPLAYLFWWTGGFGGADAKALMTVALLLPAYPTYDLPWATLPVQGTNVGVLSFTVLTNTVLFGAAAPLVLAARNAAAGRLSTTMFLGRPVPVEAVPETHGRLLSAPDGGTRRGVDLDALRMYLRWRGVDLATLRANPDALRDPATLPDDPNPPTDGAVTAATPEPTVPDAVAAGGDSTDAADEFDDPWGARAFLADVDGAYGASARDVREGLDVLTAAETVWVSPGVPFLVPTFAGLAVALTYGDVLFGLFELAGLV